MKKLLLLSLIALLAVGCSTQVSNTATLMGVAENSADFFILRSETLQDTIAVQEDGSFQYTIDSIDKATNYRLSLDSEYYFDIYIAPGQELTMTFDREDLEGTLKYTGDAADMHNYMAARDFFNDELLLGRDFWAQKYPDFIKQTDSIRDSRMKIFESAEKEDEEDVFWKVKKADILYEWALQMHMYPRYYPYASGDQEQVLPDDYHAFKESMEINKPEYLGSENFKRYVYEIVADSLNEYKAFNPPEDDYLFFMEKSADYIKDQEVLDDYRAGMMINMLPMVSLDELSAAIEFLLANLEDEKLLADINNELEQYKKLAEGMPGLDFTGEDIDGNVMRFSDFRGKYVYVDLWATWCGPCRGEIPFLKEMEKDYHGRNIVFLSFSIDDDKEAWEKFVVEEELGGVQLFGENAWQNELPQYYKIQGIPRFMLFDPEGKIITTNMTRPSDEKTRERFDGYADL